MTVGERIKARRKELNMSADALAEKIGVSRSTMFRYECGDIEKLPASSLEPIARVLHTSVENLMGWDTISAVIPPALNRLTDDEAEFLSYYRDAEEPIRKAAKTMLRDSAEENRKKERPASVS